jgi:hypothetical protein
MQQWILRVGYVNRIKRDGMNFARFSGRIETGLDYCQVKIDVILSMI